MTREEHIYEASKAYSEYEYNQTDYENGFINGAKWADRNPNLREEPNLESLWHDANIVPSENKGIIYLTKNNKFGVFNSIKSNNWDWYISGKYSIIKWAYVSDLLLKGGKE